MRASTFQQVSFLGELSFKVKRQLHIEMIINAKSQIYLYKILL